MVAMTADKCLRAMRLLVIGASALWGGHSVSTEIAGLGLIATARLSLGCVPSVREKTLGFRWVQSSSPLEFGGRYSATVHLRQPVAALHGRCRSKSSNRERFS